MGSHDKEAQENLSKKDKGASEGQMKMESASAYHPDPEHMKRHDEEHNRDLALAAMLQAKWAAVADAQHKPH